MSTSFFTRCLCSLASIIILSAAGASAQNPLYGTIQHGSTTRSFLLHIPAGYTPGGPARALILNMHGLGSSDTEQYFYSNFAPIADTAGFIMVVPQGSRFNGTNYWNVGLPGTPPTDDMGFLSALIDSLADDYNIDKDRVYATGMSNGGYMSFFMACGLSSKITAIASVTGSMVESVYNSCSPSRAVPVMQIHGTADGTVPYNGGAYNVATDSVMKKWAMLNGCNPQPTVTPVPDINTTDNSTATHYVWSGGTGGANNELYKITGGGHTWPGSPFIVGVTNQDFNASKEIWRFFSQFNRRQFLSTGDVLKGADHYAARPNPATDRVRISEKESKVWTLTSMVGGIARNGKGTEVDISQMPAGIYLLRVGEGPAATVQRITKR